MRCGLILSGNSSDIEKCFERIKNAAIAEDCEIVYYKFDEDKLFLFSTKQGGGWQK